MRGFWRSTNHFRLLALLPLLALVFAACENPLEVGFGDRVDLEAPQVALSSHQPGAYLRGSVELSGSVTDDIGVSTVEISFDRGAAWTAVTHAPDQQSWTFSLDTTTRADGRLGVTLRAKDAADRVTTTEELLFSIDNTAPLVMVTTPRNYQSVVFNTAATLTIEAFDVYPVVEYGVEVFDADSGERLAGFPQTAQQSVSPWSYQFFSAAFTSAIGRPQRRFRFALWAVDEAGNRSTQFFHTDDVAALNNNQPLTIAQVAAARSTGSIARSTGDSLTWQQIAERAYANGGEGAQRFVVNFDEELNIPRVGITYPTGTAHSATMKTGETFRGYFEDDDGIDVATMAVRIQRNTDVVSQFEPPGATWVDSFPGDGWSTLTTYSLNSEIGARRVEWSLPATAFRSPDGALQGYYRVLLRARDLGGEVTAAYQRNILVSDFEATIAVDPPSDIYFSDRFQLSGLYEASELITSITFNVGYGPSTNVTWLFPSDETSELQATFVRATSGEQTWTFDSGTIDWSAAPWSQLADGTVRVRVSANSGSVRGSAFQNLTLDRAPPTIAVQTPVAGSPLNSVARIQGAANDVLAGMECVAVRVVPRGTALDTANCDQWWNFAAGSAANSLATNGFAFSGSLTNWTLRFDTTAAGFPDGPYTLYARSLDRAGNSAVAGRDFDINQDSDLPAITFLNINAAADNFMANVLDGQPRLIGSLSDDTNVSPATFQYRVRPDGGDWIGAATDGGWRSFYSGDGVPANIPQHSFNVELRDPALPAEFLGTGRYYVQVWVADENGLGLFRGDKNAADAPLQVLITVNSGPPTISLTAPAAGSIFRDAITVTGSAAHPLGLQRVEISTDNGATYRSPPLYQFEGSGLGDVSHDFSYSVADIATDGPLTVRVRAVDGAGNSAIESVALVRDTQPPSVEISGIAPVVFAAGVGALDRINNVVTVNVLAADANAVAGVKYWLLDPTAAAPDYATAGGVEDTGLPYSFTIDSRDPQYTDQHDYRLYVIARDRAGNEQRVYSDLRIDQSSDVPTVTFSDIDATIDTEAAAVAAASGANRTNFMELTPRLRGVVEDDDMVDAGGIRIAIDGGGWQVLSGPVGTNSRSVGFTHDLSALADGPHSFSLQFSDLAAAKTGGVAAATRSVGPIYFVIDRSSPQVTITGPATGSYLNTAFTITGTASDPSGLATTGSGETEYLLVRPPGVADWAAATAVAVDGTGAWSYPVDGLFDGAHEGSKTFEMRAVDRFGKYSNAPLTIVVDTVAPQPVVTQPAAGEWLRGSSNPTAGGATDAGSGVGQVRFWVGAPTSDPPADLEQWIIASGATQWNGTLNLSALVDSLGEGPKRLFVRARDGAGNWSAAVTRDFGIDQAAPVQTLDGDFAAAGEVGRNEVFSLSGSAGDANGLARLEVHQRIGSGGEYQLIETILLNATPAVTSHAWSVASLPRLAVDPTAPRPFGEPLADGRYYYQIRLWDLAGEPLSPPVSVERVVVVDLTGPQATISEPAGGAYLSGTAVTARGTAIDNLGADAQPVSPIAEVRYWVGNRRALPLDYHTELTGWSAVTGTTTWNQTIALSGGGGVGEGAKTLFVAARDQAGNWSAPEDVAARDFVVDQSAPTIDALSIADAGGGLPQVLAGGLSYRNSAFELSFTAADTNALQQVVVTRNGSVVYDQAHGGTSATIGPLVQTPGAGAGELADGTYEYVFTVTDVVGRSTNLTRSIMVDTASPVLSISAPTPPAVVGTLSTEIVDTAAYVLRGQVTDQSGKGVVALDYSLDSSDGVDGTWLPISPAFSWSHTLNLGTDEGIRRVWVSADDGLNTPTVADVRFAFDLSAPSIVEDQVASEARQIRNSAVAFGGSIGDTNGLARIEVALNGGAPTTIATWPQAPATVEPQTAGWSYQLPATTAGDYALTFTVYDVAGRSAGLTRSVLIDTAVPDAPVINPPADQYFVNNLVVSGSAVDNGSPAGGIQQVAYRFNPLQNPAGTWTAVSGTEDWFQTIAIGSTGANLPEGRHTIAVRSTDRAGNLSPAGELEFWVDRADPTLGFDVGWTAGAARYTKTALTLSGSASDVNGIQAVTVDNGSGSGPVAATAAADFATWQYAVPAAVEGTTVYTVAVTDSVGRVTTAERTVIVDLNGPEVAIVEPVAVPATPPVLSGGSFTARGTAVDVGEVSAISEVRYVVVATGDAAAVPADFEDWHSAIGGANWTVALDLTAVGEGPKTLWVVAKDAAGNWSAAATGVDFVVDQGPPTINVLQLDAAAFAEGTQYRNAAYQVSFTAADTNALARVVVTRNGATIYDQAHSGGTAAIGPLTQTPGSAAEQLADATYTYVITVTDAVGRSVGATRSVMVDTLSPELSITAPLPPTGGAGVSSEVVAAPAYTIRGLVNDGTGKGVAGLVYAVRGPNNWTEDPADIAGGEWTAVPIAFSWSQSGVNPSEGVGYSGQGLRRLWVKADDGLNAPTIAYVDFQYDTEPPTLTETVVDSIDEQVTNSVLAFGGRATDSNALSALTVSVNGGAAQPVVVDVATGDWSFALPTVAGQPTQPVAGGYQLVFTARDVAGRTTTLTRRALVDTTAPPAPTPVAAVGTYVVNELAVNGTAVDADSAAPSGIARVEYQLNATSGDWHPAGGTGTWFRTIDLNADDGTLDPALAATLPEGAHTLYIRSVDRAGNASPPATRAFVVDRADPTLDETTINTTDVRYTAGAVNIGGPVGDVNAISAIGVAVNGAAALPAAYDAGAGTWSFSDATPQQGTNVYTITATDGVGRTTSVVRTVVYDTAAPSVEVTTFVPVVVDAGDPGNPQEMVNGVLTIALAAADENGLAAAAVRWWLLPEGQPAPDYTTSVDPVVLAGLAGSGGSFAATPYLATVDTRTLHANGPGEPGAAYVYYVLVRDRAGNETGLSRQLTIDQNSDLPTVEFTDLDAAVGEAAQAGINGINLLDFNARIRGVVYDDDRVDAASLRIRVNAHDGVVDDGFIALSGPNGPNGVSTSYSHSLDLPQGVHFFYLRFADLASAKNGAAAVSRTVGPVYFAIDTAPPTLTIAGPPAGAFRNTDFLITGNAADANGLAVADIDNDPLTPAVAYVRVRPPAAATWDDPAVTDVEVAGNGAWQYGVLVDPDGAGDGPQAYQFRTIDRFGKSTVVVYNFTIDTEQPQPTVATPVATDWLQGPTAGLTGAATDAGGIAQVRYWLPAAGAVAPFVPPVDMTEWTLASGTTNWSGSINLGVLDEGENRVFVRVQDVAGNWSEPLQRSFGVDQALPTVSETQLAAAAVARSAVFDIAGAAADSNALQSVVVTQQRGDGAVVTVHSATLAGTGDTWSVGALPRDPDAPDPTDPAAVVVTDGVYQYQIVVTDVAGKTAQVTRSVTVDLVGPVVTIEEPSDGQRLSGSAYNLRGTAADVADVSAIAQVWYWVGPSGVAPPAAIESEWTLAGGTTGWTASLALDGIGGLGEGAMTATVVARDAAGNWSATPAARSFIIDQNPPTLTETSVGGGATMVYRNGAFSLSGSATDSNGLADVTIYQDEVLIDTLALSGTGDTWQIDGLPRNPADTAATLVTDGLISFRVVVRDNAERTGELTRNVTVDATPPTAAISSLVPLIDGATVNGVVHFSADANDLSVPLDVRWWFLPDPGGEPVAPAFDSVGGTSFAAAPYASSFDTTTVVDGAYRLWVVARDRAQNEFAVSQALVVDQSSDAPQFTYNFVGGVTFNSTPFSLSGTVTDEDGLASVAWKLPTAAEWTPIQTWATNYPTSYAWNVSVDVSDGVDRTIDLRAVDRRGETAFATAAVASPTFSVLTQSPILTFAGPNTGDFFNGSGPITLSGSARVESTDVTVQSLAYRLGVEDWVDITTAYSPAVDNPSTGTYSVDIPAAAVAVYRDGVLRIRVQAVGTNGNSSLETLEVRIDTIGPSVVFGGPAAGLTVNGDLNIAGTAADTSPGVIDRVALAVIRDADASVVWSRNDVGRFNWSNSGDLIDTRDLTDGETYTLRATAFDAAGNSTSADRTITVDQSTDTPSVVFSNLETATAAVGYPSVFLSNGNITGSAFDDDGVASVEYEFNGSGDWMLLNLGGATSESFAVPYGGLSDGLHSLRLRVTDVVGNAAGSFETAAVGFRLDRTNPSVSIVGPAGGSAFNGDFTLTATAADANGIVGVETSTDGVNFVAAGYDAGSGVWSGPVSVGSLADGPVTVTVRATDGAGRQATQDRQFAVDTTPPGVAFTAPVAAPPAVGGGRVNRSILISGTSSDSGGSVATVEMFIVDAGDGTTLVAVPGLTGTSPWSLTFDTLRLTESPIDGGDLFGRAVEVDPATGGLQPGSGVWQATLRAVATDAAGNTAATDRSVWIDQESNRPTIALSNLAGDGSSVFASLSTIAGSVADDDGVGSVYYRYNALSDAASWLNVLTGGGTAVNFNVPMTGLADGLNRLEVRADDSLGGAYSDATFGPVEFRIDTQPPELTIATPGLNAFFNGPLTVTGTAADANGIHQVRARIGITGEWVSIEGSELVAGAYSIDLPVTGLAQTIHSVYVVAEDTTGKTTQVTRDFTYDTTPPVVAVLTPDAGVNVNGRVTLRGSSSDESGIQRTEFRIGTKGDLNANWQQFANRFNWEQVFLSIDQYGSTEFADETTVGMNIWNLPILIRAVDPAGNTQLIADYSLTVDPAGDNPEAVILQPGTGNTVGGRVRLSGSAVDDDAVYRVEVAFDMNNDDSFAGPGDLWPTPTGGWPVGTEPTALVQVAEPVGAGETFADATTTAWYAVTPGTADWSNWFINLNTYGEFDPASGQTRTINIKVRAVDTKGGGLQGLAGNAEVITVTFDSNAPRIEDLNLQTGDIVGGVVTFQGLVRDPTGLESFRYIRANTSTFLINNGNVLDAARIELVTSGPDFEVGSVTYRFNVPVDTTMITSSGPAFFTFEATKGSYVSQSYVNLQVDNLDPSGAFTSADTINVNAVDYAQIAGTNYTLQGNASDGGSVAGVDSVVAYLLASGQAYDLRKQIYSGARASAAAPVPATSLVAGQRYVIVGVGSSDFTAVGADRNQTGTVFVATGAGGGTGTVLGEPYFVVIDRLNEEGQDAVEGKGDQDGFNESLSLSAGLVNWYVQFDSTLIPDGPATIHYAVTDVGRNTVAYERSAFVANNRPVIDSITLGTDLTGNGLTDGDGERSIFAGSYTATDFTVRNSRLYFGIQRTFGNGTATYRVEYDQAGTWVPLYTDTTASTTITNFSTPATIADTIVTGTEAANAARFRVSVTDALGLVDQRIVQMNIDNIDSIAPALQAADFGMRFGFNATTGVRESMPVAEYAQNIVTSGAAPDVIRHGYVQYFGDSTNDGADPADADLSGKVVFHGSAGDNQLVQRLTAQIPGYDGGAGDGLEFIIAAWDPAAADGAGAIGAAAGPPERSIAAVAAGTSDWGFEVVAGSESVTEATGHAFFFRFAWNTAAIEDVARLDVPVTFRVYDFNSDNDGAAGTADAVTADIVPYIARITTADQANAGGLKDINIRATNGRYSIKAGSDPAFITVHGFNLAPIADGVRIAPPSSRDGLNAGTLSGDALAFNPPNATFTTLTLSNAAARSGYLGIVSGTGVNPVASVNNTNRVSAVYNAEPDAIVSRNTLLTDDRYLSFYSVTDTGIANAVYPNMLMVDDTPIWGYVQSGAAGDKQVRRGTTAADSVPLVRSLAADQIAMARDDADRYHMISVTNFNNGRMHYFNHLYATYYQGANGYDGLGDNGASSPYWSTFTSNRNYTSAATNNAVDLDSVNYTPGLQLSRYVRPILRTVGDTTTAAGAGMYLVFFDSFAGELVFRNWRVYSGTTGDSALYQDDGTYRSTQGDVGVNAGDTSRKVIATNASEHFSMVVTADGYVVVGYYDQSISRFVVRYTATADGTTPQAITGDTPTATVNWSTPILVGQPYYGWYPSMVIDDAGRIHISAYDSAGAALVYMQMAGYNDATPLAVVVDTFNSVGYYNEIQLAADGRPWIAYYNISETGTRDAIRLANYTGTMPNVTAGVDANGFVSGDWDVATVPVGTVPRGAQSNFLKVNLGFTTGNVPTVGYAGNSLEYVQPLPAVP